MDATTYGQSMYTTNNVTNDTANYLNSTPKTMPKYSFLASHGYNTTTPTYYGYQYYDNNGQYSSYANDSSFNYQYGNNSVSSNSPASTSTSSSTSSLANSFNYNYNYNYESSNSSFNSYYDYSGVQSTYNQNAQTESTTFKYDQQPTLSNKARTESRALSKKHQLPDRAVDIMNEWFEEHLHNPYPQLCEKEKLAELGGITVKQVTAWFSNRRNRSQNTKPKRMKRVLEKEIGEIYQELVYNGNKEQIIEKFRSTLASHELALKPLHLNNNQ